MAISGGLDGEIEFHPNVMVEANSIMICQMMPLMSNVIPNTNAMSNEMSNSNANVDAG